MYKYRATPKSKQVSESIVDLYIIKRKAPRTKVLTQRKPYDNKGNYSDGF